MFGILVRFFFFFFWFKSRIVHCLLHSHCWSHPLTPPASFAKSHKHRLITSCIITLRWPLTAVIIPRLVQLAFTICQPLVLNRFLVFLSDAPESPNVGYGLVAAYGLVYFGIATSQALYWHSNARFVTMLRGTLVTAVFSKATEISITATDNAAAVTLMSTDVSLPRISPTTAS